MHTNRFKSLSTPITADNQNMSHETSAALKPAPLIPNSRWTQAQEDMHTNPFRQSGEARFSHRDPPRTNSRWQDEDSDAKNGAPFRQPRETRFSHRDPPRTNSRWQDEDSDAKNNAPFRRPRENRFSRGGPPPTNSRWQNDDNDAQNSTPFRRPRENRFSRRGPPPTNSRWQNDDSEDKRRGGDMFKRRDRREPNSRYQSRREFNSFNRRTKQAPKPVFKMENTDFPPLGKAESPVSSSPNMNFSKAAHKNKDRPGPKHIIQFPERMPRTKKENLDERDPLDWNTDDENEAYEATACNDEREVEPDWPAKGGYID